MPLSDWINLNPANEATGGYNSGLGMTADELNALNASIYNYQNAANTIGQPTPFEQYQQYRNSLIPGNVSTIEAMRTGEDQSVYVNPAVAGIIGPTNISATGQAPSVIPTNPFAGPIPLTGIYGAGANALYNIGAGALNYVSNLGTNQVALGDLPSGNVSIETGYNPNYPNYLANVSTVNAAGNPSGVAWNPAMWSPTGNTASGFMAGQGYGSESAGLVAMDLNPRIATGTTGAGSSIPNDVGVVGMDPFNVTDTRFTGGPASFGGTSNLDRPTSYDVGGAAGAAPGAGTVLMDPFQIASSNLPRVSLMASLSPTVSISPTPTEVTPGPATLPPVTIVTNRPTSPTVSVSPTVTISLTPTPTEVTPSPTMLPTVTVVTNRPTSPTVSVSPTVTTTVPTETPTRVVTPPVSPTPSNTPSATTPQVSVTTPIISPTRDVFEPPAVTSAPTITSTATTNMPTDRNFARELGESYDALQKKQQDLLNYYNQIYQKFMPETLTQAAATSLGQLNTDAARLARIQSGYLSPEDTRNAVQAAREAYAARGQVMGQGAVGAEILGRENIRQQRENEARAAYQQSIGNVLNTANLQTGNVFQPVSSLIANTFNPLGQYPQDVYNSNFNAAVAQQIAEANNKAAIEAAKQGASAQQNAAYISALGKIFGNTDFSKFDWSKWF